MEITRKVIAERLLESTKKDLKFQLIFERQTLDWDHFIDTAKRAKLAQETINSENSK